MTHPHHYREHAESAIVEDELWHGSDTMGSPVDLHTERYTSIPLLGAESLATIQSRQGYVSPRFNGDKPCNPRFEANRIVT